MDNPETLATLDTRNTGRRQTKPPPKNIEMIWNACFIFLQSYCVLTRIWISEYWTIFLLNLSSHPSSVRTIIFYTKPKHYVVCCEDRPANVKKTHHSQRQSSA